MSLITNMDYRYQVGMGYISDAQTWNKFGYNTDIDSGSGEEVIASFGGPINIMTSADTLDIFSSDANDTNSSGTGARSVRVTGIDENNEIQEVDYNLNGVTKVTTAEQWLGINRVVVLTSGSSGTNEGTITVEDTGGTVGTQAEIPIGASVTEQCIFHTPIDYTLLTDWLKLNALKVSGGGGSPRVTFRGYSFSRVTGTTYEILNIDIDTDVENTISLSPSQPFIIQGREVLYFTAETDVNNTSVSCRFSGILKAV